MDFQKYKMKRPMPTEKDVLSDVEDQKQALRVFKIRWRQEQIALRM